MNDTKYILIGQTPVPCELMEWAQAFETTDRRVAGWRFGPVWVSTVFMGLELNIHRMLGEPGAPSQLFETMIFVLGASVWQKRSGTWIEAEGAHAEAVRCVCTVWRRPRELAGWIREGIEHWISAWDQKFASRYPRRDVLLLRAED